MRLLILWAFATATLFACFLLAYHCTIALANLLPS